MGLYKVCFFRNSAKRTNTQSVSPLAGKKERKKKTLICARTIPIKDIITGSHFHTEFSTRQ